VAFSLSRKWPQGKRLHPIFRFRGSTDPADSFLISVEEIRTLLSKTGFIAVHFEDISDAHSTMTPADNAPSALTLAEFVDKLAQKAGNARRSPREGQIRLGPGVCRVK